MDRETAAQDAEVRVEEVIGEVEALLRPKRLDFNWSLLAPALILAAALSALTLLDLFNGRFSAWMQAHTIVTGFLTGSILVLVTALVVDRLIRRQERQKTDRPALSAIDDLGAACARGAWEILNVALKSLNGSPVVTSMGLNDVIVALLSGADLDAFSPKVSAELVRVTKAVSERTKEIAGRCGFLAGRDDVQQLLVRYQELSAVLESLQSCGAVVLSDEMAAPLRAASWYGVANAIAILPKLASQLLAEANEARAKRFLLDGKNSEFRRAMETQMHSDLLRDNVYRSSIKWEATLGPT